MYRIKTTDEDLSDNRNTNKSVKDKNQLRIYLITEIQIKVYRIKTTDEDLSDNRNTNKSVQDKNN